MNDNKTASILQRLPVILAVTAASYGLALPASARNTATASGATSQAQHSQPVVRH